MANIINDEKTSLIEHLKSLPSMVQRTDLVTVKDINPKSGKPFTSKDKRVLGIPEENSTVWTPFHMPNDVHSRFEVFCEKIIGRRSFEVATEILQDWMSKNESIIQESTIEFMKEEKSEEDIQKQIDYLRRQMEKNIELLKSKRS